MSTSTSTDEDMSAARERVLLAADFAAACAASLEIRESAIVAIEAAAIAEPTAKNTARAEYARAELDDARRDHAEAKAARDAAEAEYARLAAAPIEGTAQA